MQSEQAVDESSNVEESASTTSETASHSLLARWEAALAFGPGFFFAHLGAYVRDRCPDPREALPFVHLHLASGEVLDVCHVIGLTTRWAALAVYEVTSRAMRTELVPYETIMRVTISPGHMQGNHMGFHQEAPPAVQETAEEALNKAAVTERGFHRRPSAGAQPHWTRPIAGEACVEPGTR